MIIADPTQNSSCGLSLFRNPENTEKETHEINMPFWGNIIYAKALSLSRKVNRELLTPISKWLDDPDFMKRHQVMIGNDVPNWAEYKRKAREWTEQQRKIAAQRLRLYWQEIHARKSHKKYINSLIPRENQGPSPILDVMPDFLAPIVSPFSPIEQARQETLRIFEQARTLSISDLLPWRILITSELTEPKTLDDLPEYAEHKQDRIAKLQHLLQMDMEGTVTINQTSPFGEVTIVPTGASQEGLFTIKDQQGQTYEFDWQGLNDNQRDKVIADIKDRRILCKGG
jgi:hypothetical protein